MIIYKIVDSYQSEIICTHKKDCNGNVSLSNTTILLLT